MIRAYWGEMRGSWPDRSTSARCQTKRHRPLFGAVWKASGWWTYQIILLNLGSGVASKTSSSNWPSLGCDPNHAAQYWWKTKPATTCILVDLDSLQNVHSTSTVEFGARMRCQIRTAARYITRILSFWPYGDHRGMCQGRTARKPLEYRWHRQSSQTLSARGSTKNWNWCQVIEIVDALV